MIQWFYVSVLVSTVLNGRQTLVLPMTRNVNSGVAYTHIDTIPGKICPCLLKKAQNEIMLMQQTSCKHQDASLWGWHKEELNYLCILSIIQGVTDLFLLRLFSLVVFQFVHSGTFSLHKLDPFHVSAITVPIHSAFPSAGRTRISTSWLWGCGHSGKFRWISYTYGTHSHTMFTEV